MKKAMAGMKRKATAAVATAAKRVKADDGAVQKAKSPSPPRSPSSSSSGSTWKCPPTKTLKEFKRSMEAVASLNEKKAEKDIWASVQPFVRRSTDSDFKPASMYKFITWNVAGLRGILRKDEKVLTKFVEKEQPDILCLQETKLNPAEGSENQKLGVIPNYCFIDHVSHTKKGYSGTRVYLHEKRMQQELRALVTCGFSLPEDAAAQQPKPTESTMIVPNKPRYGSDKVLWAPDEEGRLQTVWLQPAAALRSAGSAGSRSPSGSRSRSASPDPNANYCPSLAFINTYVPNSGMTLDRLPFRIEHFDTAMRSYLKDVQQLCRENLSGSKKQIKAAGVQAESLPCGVIWTGDLNVAERDFDRYYAGTWKKMQECSGFTPEERFSFRQTLSEMGGAGDAFRMLYPNAGPTYTFWSARIKGREKGLGWRLDYFVLSKELLPFVVDVFPMPEQTASDHCPVQLWMKKRVKA